MLVSIRRRAPLPPEREPDVLLQLLLACHARIRAFACLAEEMGRRRDLAPREVVEACQRCVRYFEEALPLHVQDEEKSLFPRLANKDSPLDDCLVTARAQHGEHAATTEALLAALRATALAPDDARVRRLLERIAQRQMLALDEHLGLEERSVFPAIDEHLSATDRELVVAELRARRQADGR